LGHLILFSISDLEFCFAGIATPSARNDNDKKLAMTIRKLAMTGSG
jgi:hypothetical protein